LPVPGPGVPRIRGQRPDRRAPDDGGRRRGDPVPGRPRPAPGRCDRQLDGRHRRDAGGPEAPRADPAPGHDRRHRPERLQPRAGRGHQAAHGVHRQPDPRGPGPVAALHGVRPPHRHRGDDRGAVEAGHRPRHPRRGPPHVRVEGDGRAREGDGGVRRAAVLGDAPQAQGRDPHHLGTGRPRQPRGHGTRPDADDPQRAGEHLPQLRALGDDRAEVRLGERRAGVPDPGGRPPMSETGQDRGTAVSGQGAEPGEHWDHEYDFVVVGSGGGGMTAALTAHDAGMSVLIIDKGKRFGGSTAVSGGGIWIPNNPTLRAAGHNDSRESIRAYLDRLTEGRVAPERLDAFIDNGPAAMELLGKSKWMKFFWTKGYSDYHPEYEGGRPEGRSIEAKPFDTRKLGEDEKYQRPNSMKGPLGLWITAKDYRDLAMVKRTWRGRRA